MKDRVAWVKGMAAGLAIMAIVMGILIYASSTSSCLDSGSASVCYRQFIFDIKYTIQGEK